MSNLPKDGKDLQIYAGIANSIWVLSRQCERLSKKSLKNRIYPVTDRIAVYYCDRSSALPEEIFHEMCNFLVAFNGLSRSKQSKMRGSIDG